MVSSRLLRVRLYWSKVAMEMGGRLTEQGARRFALVRVNLSDMSCGSDLALLLTFEVHLHFLPDSRVGELNNCHAVFLAL